MTIPKTIQTKEQWESYKKQFTNDGKKGYFEDGYGILHYIWNVQKPTPEDIRLYMWNKTDRMGYLESEFVILPPPHLLKNPDETFTKGAFARWS